MIKIIIKVIKKTVTQYVTRRELPSAIHKLAWRKNYTVSQGMEGGRWMRDLQKISTGEEINSPLG
jgi:hypothetical protein